MASTKSKKMLKALKLSMKLGFLSAEDRNQQEIKLKLTEKIDHILYTQWDPCGVYIPSDLCMSDEYHRYLPVIVDMVLQDKSVSEISDQLMVFEDGILGDMYQRRRCDVIAVMVKRYDPYATNDQFTFSIDTHTPETAYQSVLNLATQTRLDAYEKKWRCVIEGFESALVICQDYLFEKHELKGACLNNLAFAYSKVGELEKAKGLFDQALPELKSAISLEDSKNWRSQKSYLLCLRNIINNLNHRREFPSTKYYFELIVRFYEQRDGLDDGWTLNAMTELRNSGNSLRLTPRLSPWMLPVEGDCR